MGGRQQFACSARPAGQPPNIPIWPRLIAVAMSRLSPLASLMERARRHSTAGLECKFADEIITSPAPATGTGATGSNAASLAPTPRAAPLLDRARLVDVPTQSTMCDASLHVMPCRVMQCTGLWLDRAASWGNNGKGPLAWKAPNRTTCASSLLLSSNDYDYVGGGGSGCVGIRPL